MKFYALFFLTHAYLYSQNFIAPVRPLTMIATDFLLFHHRQGPGSPQHSIDMFNSMNKAGYTAQDAYFSPSKITGDGRMDGRTDGYTLL